MELKARLSFLEHQINSLQSLLLQKSEISPSNPPQRPNYKENNNFINLGNVNDDQDNLKNILMKLKLEHEMVLKNIEKALELVSNNLTTPEKPPSERKFFTQQSQTNFNSNCNSSPVRLREKINSLLWNNPSLSSPTTPKTFPHHTNRNSHPPHSHISSSSPLSPAVEKSHITFDILNELESSPNFKRKSVHFKGEEGVGQDDMELMSLASKDYLKKYGLI